jgi:hypothetical protein
LFFAYLVVRQHFSVHLVVHNRQKVGNPCSKALFNNIILGDPGYPGSFNYYQKLYILQINTGRFTLLSSAGLSKSVENPVSCKTSPDPFLAAAFPLTVVGRQCESSCAPDESVVAANAIVLVVAPVAIVTAVVVATPGVVAPLLRK